MWERRVKKARRGVVAACIWGVGFGQLWGTRFRIDVTPHQNYCYKLRLQTATVNFEISKWLNC